MKKYKKIIIFFLLMAMAVSMCACDESSPNETAVPTQQNDPTQEQTVPGNEATGPIDLSTLWTQGESPVPADRTGIKRQCVFPTNKAYEFTETGAYFLPRDFSYLIYADHGSDTFVMVCGRPDCPHNNSTCDAYFGGATSVCYYDGYLYILDLFGVLRMNMDGTDKVRVFSFSDLGAYQGLQQLVLWNGLLSFSTKRVDSDGKEVYTCYYYYLDGSMDMPAEGGIPLPSFNHNGKFYGQAINPDGSTGYEVWDPETDKLSYICDFVEGGGYRTEAFSIQLQGSNVCCYTYADKIFTPLFDTGLEGELFLHCFPDCIVVSQKLDEKYSLHFYDWTYASRGSVEIEQEVTLWGQMDIICGETEERIMLSLSSTGLPEYYIEKSEFGTENLALHKYDLPDLTWQFVQP